MKYERINLDFDRHLPAPGSDRTAERSCVSLAANVRSGSDQWTPCRIYDLSRTGVRLNWVPHFCIGRRIWFRINTLAPFPATLRWKDNSGIGCQFDSTLSEYVAEHLCRVGAL